MKLRTLVSMAALAAQACVPTLDDPTSRVTEPRILAIRAVPAEAAPNQNVQLTALYADASGTLSMGPLSWTYCTTRKPLAELGPVARACFDATSMGQVAIGTGLTVSGRLPRDACRLFGPNPPPAVQGEPNGRPVDPDPTGGYYQPTIAFRTDATDGDPTLAQVRIACSLANAPSDVTIEYGQRYRRNANPTISSLVLLQGGNSTPVPTDGAGAPPTIHVNESVRLEVAWPDCPTDGVCGDGICGDDESSTSCAGDCVGSNPPTCNGAETYVRFDSTSLALVRARESMHVTWYGNRGSFETARTGRAGDDLVNASDVGFTAPASAGDVVVWVVVRDERGGTEFSAHRITVVP